MGSAARTPVSGHVMLLVALLPGLAAPAGGNVWSWSGEGRPREAGEDWAVGDRFTGDPPHERQGWYSIYDDDAGTLALIREYATRKEAVGAGATEPEG